MLELEGILDDHVNAAAYAATSGNDCHDSMAAAVSDADREFSRTYPAFKGTESGTITTIAGNVALTGTSLQQG